MSHAGPTVRVLTVSAPTIVLGSSQKEDVVDAPLATAKGIEVVRRRSGGGAVWLDDDLIWVDVFVPAGDQRTDADVGRAMWWLGEAWVQAASAVGVEGATVHTGPLRTTPWSSLVCWAGLGAGEVTVDGRKVVGISQRRTRAGALFQCGVLRRWNPTELIDGLVLDDDRRAEAMFALETAGHGLGPELSNAVLAAFIDDLSQY